MNCPGNIPQQHPLLWHLSYVAPTVESTSEMTVDVFDEEINELSLLQLRLLSLRFRLQGGRLVENRGRVAVVVLAEEEVRGGVWRDRRRGGGHRLCDDDARHRETFGLPM